MTLFLRNLQIMLTYYPLDILHKSALRNRATRKVEGLARAPFSWSVHALSFLSAANPTGKWTLLWWQKNIPSFPSWWSPLEMHKRGFTGPILQTRRFYGYRPKWIGKLASISYMQSGYFFFALVGFYFEDKIFSKLSIGHFRLMILV